MSVSSVMFRRLAILGLVYLLCMVGYDSRQHFDSELVELKKKYHSGQRNWNVHFGQGNVYQSGGLKHENDFKLIAALIEPGATVFTDIATSYYMAANLPVYVKNIHLHHGRHKSADWHTLLNKGIGCYIDIPENMTAFARLVAIDRQRTINSNPPRAFYIAVNKTQGNINFSRDCLSQRRTALITALDQVAEPVFDGDTIWLYKWRE